MGKTLTVQYDFFFKFEGKCFSICIQLFSTISLKISGDSKLRHTDKWKLVSPLIWV